MKKNKKQLDKWSIVVIIALLLAVSGVTFGFAAVSRYIIIQSNTKVKYNEYDFKVQFSSNKNGISNDLVTPITYPQGLKATNAYIDNSERDSVIRNLSVEFSAPGQSATYYFYAYNSGKYAAYLKSINFNNVQGTDLNKVCIATDSGEQSVVDKVCDDINISVKVGKENPTSSTIKNINSHILLRNNPEPVVVTISYDDDGLVANDDFTVKFGEISLHYSVVD